MLFRKSILNATDRTSTGGRFCAGGGKGRVWPILAAFALVAPVWTALAKLNPAEIAVEAPVYSIRSGPVRPAETWVFDISWTGVPVGQATIEVTADVLAPSESAVRLENSASSAALDAGDQNPPAVENIESGPSMDAIKVDITASTNSFIDFFWRYRLHARGKIETNPFAPGQFYSEELERSKQKRTTIEFDEQGNVTASRQKGEKITEHAFSAPNTYDMISTMFATLSFDYEPGAHYVFDTFTGTSRYLIEVFVRDRGPFETAGRTFDAWRLEVKTKGLTDPDETEKHDTTSLWVTADEPRRLLGCRSEVFIGSVNVKLASLSTGAASFDQQPEFRPAAPKAPEPTRARTLGAGRVSGASRP
jgi:hypothetical protein